VVKCWVESAGSGPKMGKGKVRFYGAEEGGIGGGLGGCMGMRGLLNFILEVSGYGIEDSVSGRGVIIIEVVVYSCLSMYVEVLYCMEVDAFFSATVTLA